MLIKYAKLSEELNIEMLGICCELISVSEYETEWREMIKNQ